MRTAQFLRNAAAMMTVALAVQTAYAAPAGQAAASANAAGAANVVSTAGVSYRTVKVDGVNVFYREAGPKDAPTILLLHGFPTSSQMFRNLIPLLAVAGVVRRDYMVGTPCSSRMVGASLGPASR